MLYYTIAHYFNNGKKMYSNIERHIIAFKQIQCDKTKIVIISAIDDIRNEKTIEDNLYAFCKNHLPDDSFIILTYYNWGGTIAALWVLFQYFKTENILYGYVSHFEEDFVPINDKWFEKSKALLHDNIYVGESNKGRLKTKNDDKRITSTLYKNTVRLGEPEVWTDGGYYFTDIQKLYIIEKNIGVFHKGNSNTKYDHNIDGISIGEVGFPTQLYHKGLQFTCLNRNDYFKHGVQ